MSLLVPFAPELHPPGAAGREGDTNRVFVPGDDDPSPHPLSLCLREDQQLIGEVIF